MIIQNTTWAVPSKPEQVESLLGTWNKGHVISLLLVAGYYDIVRVTATPPRPLSAKFIMQVFHKAIHHCMMICIF